MMFDKRVAEEEAKKEFRAELAKKMAAKRRQRLVNQFLADYYSKFERILREFRDDVC